MSALNVLSVVSTASTFSKAEGVKKAMEMFHANNSITKEEVVKATGLAGEIALRAMKMAASGKEPMALSGVQLTRMCQDMELPKFLSSIINKTDKDFESRRAHTADPTKGYHERSALKQKQESKGDTIPLARELSPGYCSKTKSLPPDLDENNIISSHIYLDPKSRVFWRKTVRVVTEETIIGPSTNTDALNGLLELSKK